MAATIFITSEGRTHENTLDDVFIIEFEGSVPFKTDIFVSVVKYLIGAVEVLVVKRLAVKIMSCFSFNFR